MNCPPHISGQEEQRIDIKIEDEPELVRLTAEINTNRMEATTWWNNPPRVTDEMQNTFRHSSILLRGRLETVPRVGNPTLGRNFFPYSEDLGGSPIEDHEWRGGEYISDRVSRNVSAMATKRVLEEGCAANLSPVYDGIVIWWIDEMADDESGSGVWTIGEEAEIKNRFIAASGYKNPTTMEKVDYSLNVAVLPYEVLEEQGISDPDVIRYEAQNSDLEVEISIDWDLCRVEDVEYLNRIFDEIPSIETIRWRGMDSVFLDVKTTVSNHCDQPPDVVGKSDIWVPDDELESERVREEVNFGKGYGAYLSENYSSLFGYYLSRGTKDEGEIKDLDIIATKSGGRELKVQARHYPVTYSDPFSMERTDVDIRLFAVPWGEIID